MEGKMRRLVPVAVAVLIASACSAGAQASKPGDALHHCNDCPEMVVVPAGSFLMGSPAGEAGHGEEEGPQHRVTIARPFAMGKFEVTFAEWAACVTGRGCAERSSRSGPAPGGRYPAFSSWDHAKEYLAWLTNRTGKSYRLPTEAEWEYAARAGTTTAYPWGNAADPNRVSCQDCTRKGLTPVGSFEPNAFGLYDMLGSLTEWVEDCWHDNYQGAPVDGSAWVTGNCATRVVRNGGAHTYLLNLRSAHRGAMRSSSEFNTLGFRVVTTP
jgi:formylglycine-generating enzyme required for sulfatase activity